MHLLCFGLALCYAFGRSHHQIDDSSFSKPVSVSLSDVLAHNKVQNCPLCTSSCQCSGWCPRCTDKCNCETGLGPENRKVSTPSLSNIQEESSASRIDRTLHHTYSRKNMQHNGDAPKLQTMTLRCNNCRKNCICSAGCSKCRKDCTCGSGALSLKTFQ